MKTKLKGDIAEQMAVVEGLKHGFSVLQPIGDRLPYDLVFERNGTFIRIQVKNSWFDSKRSNYVIDNRKCITNQRSIKHRGYSEHDFDFALAYIEDLNVFYVFPVKVFLSYASEIHLVEQSKRQRKPRSIEYRNAWSLIK